MTAMSHTSFEESAFGAGFPVHSHSVQVQETFWGYIIRPADGRPTMMMIGQALAWLFGVSTAVSALGLWVVPGILQDTSSLPFRLGASVLLAGMAVLLLWYASRGTEIEIQVDTRKGEVREVVRNHAGRPSVIGRYGFDSIGGTFLDRRNERHGEATLVLRYRNTSTLVTVAQGPVAQLEILKDRLGCDLLLDPTVTSRALAVEPGPLTHVAA